MSIRRTTGAGDVDASRGEGDGADQSLLRQSSEEARGDGLLPSLREGDIEDGGQTSCISRWMTPRAVLSIFALLNFVTYFDRGAIAGCLTAIKVDSTIRGDESSLSDTRSGVIVSGFMVGYMLTCPLFAALGACIRAKYIILLGMLVWSAACLSTAASTTFWMLLASRLFVGIGEAAFVGFTVTILDNIAPARRRTLWIGTFYSMIPVGTAAGMAVGGVCGDVHSLLGTRLQPWRMVFVGEVAASIPVIFLIAALPHRYDVEQSDEGHLHTDPPLSTAAEDLSAAEVPAAEYVPLHTATARLLRNADYVLVVAGFAMYCAVVGAISVWAIPMLAQGPLHLPVGKAALLMGSTTAACGIAGSLFGGWAVDVMGGSQGKRGSAKCVLFSAAMVAACVPCGAAALLQVRVVPFVVAFLVSVLTLFSITAPINASILTVVPHALRPYAVSYSVFFIHFFGDFPSPTITGALSDQFNRGCREYRDAKSCLEAPAVEGGVFRSRLCFWVGDGDPHQLLRAAPPPRAADERKGHCVNTFQIRDALLIIFFFLAIAVPCWMSVCIRLRRKAREEERISDVVVVVAGTRESA